MALGPQKPSNGCPVDDFQVSVGDGGKVVVYPLRDVASHRMLEWVARKLHAPDVPEQASDFVGALAYRLRQALDATTKAPVKWLVPREHENEWLVWRSAVRHILVEADRPLPEPSKAKLCCATMRVSGRHSICGLTRGHSGEHIAPTGDLSWQEDTSEQMYARWLAVRELEAKATMRPTDAEIAAYIERSGLAAKILPGTDWVIARNPRRWAASQPGASPAQPGLPEEVFWSGAVWVVDVGLAKRFRGTQHAINEILMARIPDDRPVHWSGAYLARVAAKPEPRYEVVDRP